jgi:hypothetical protein
MHGSPSAHNHAHDHGTSHHHRAGLAPRFSLMRLSLPQRLALVVPALAVLWLGAFWAMG